MASLTAFNGDRLKILGIPGSLRKGSFNTALLRTAQELADEEMEITIFDLKDIPLYNGDVEDEGDPEAVTTFKAAIRDADGILIATPEYNFSTSGVLKNAIDWASRDRGDHSLNGKPVTVVGAGGRSGTARAQMDLQHILAETGSLLMSKPGVLVAFPWEKFDTRGKLVDEATRDTLRQHLEAFTLWVNRVGRPREARPV